MLLAVSRRSTVWRLLSWSAWFQLMCRRIVCGDGVLPEGNRVGVETFSGRGEVDLMGRIDMPYGKEEMALLEEEVLPVFCELGT
ncbi:MAG: hypothetical protein RLZZ609_2978 [Cyanobacteriota bacterium]|jgi:hypothetical protein